MDDVQRVRVEGGRPTRGRGGFSLIELLISLTLIGILLGSLGLVGRTTSDSVSTSMTVSELEARGRVAFDAMVGLVRAATLDQVTPTPQSPFSTSSVDLIRTVDCVAGTPTWGPMERLEFRYTAADPDDGIDNDGNGMIDDGIVVHVQNPGQPIEVLRVLCRGVPELLEGEIANGVDDNGNGLRDETGFCVEVDGARATVRLTVAELDASSGVFVQRTSTRVVAIRNATP